MLLFRAIYQQVALKQVYDGKQRHFHWSIWMDRFTDDTGYTPMKLAYKNDTICALLTLINSKNVVEQQSSKLYAILRK